MLDKSYNYNKQVILNDINITNSIIKLINEAYNNNLDDDSFKNQFFNLSKTIYFFYQISKLYINLFSNETKLHEIFTYLKKNMMKIKMIILIQLEFLLLIIK